jgi:hypothetical protein
MAKRFPTSPSVLSAVSDEEDEEGTAKLQKPRKLQKMNADKTWACGGASLTNAGFQLALKKVDEHWIPIVVADPTKGRGNKPTGKGGFSRG